MTPWQLRHAARILRAGGVVAYPTEAVWGLGCDPGDPAAVLRVCALKGRPAAKGLIVIAADLGQCSQWLAPLTAAEAARIGDDSGAPTTWLIPAAPAAPPWLCGEHATLAVRVTRHPVAAALCRRAGMALVSTSANPATRPPARDALRVRQYFGEHLDHLVPGATGGWRSPSVIRELRGDLVLRGA